MQYTISPTFHLHQKKNKYYLYNKVSTINYEISYKLYFILSLFYKRSYSIIELNNEFDKKRITLSDFYQFLQQPQFTTLLIPSSSEKNIIQHHNNWQLPESTEPFPERVDFFITKHCNLSCKHCFEGAAPSFPIHEISLEQLELLITQLEAANVKTLKITGGEPFSHSNIDELLDLVSSCHFETIILTNALLINSERIKIIKKGEIKLGISLDGIRPKSHDYIRGKGTFEKVIKVLNTLSNENIIFSITCTLNKMNLSELDEIVHFSLNKLNAYTLYLNCLRPIGRTNQNQNIVLSEEDNRYIHQRYIYYKSIYNDRILLSDDTIIEKDNTLNNNVTCLAGNSLIAIDENLDVYPCIYGINSPLYNMGSLLNMPLDDIWNSTKWNIFRGELKVQDLTDCKDCKLNMHCLIRNCRLKPIYEGRSFTSSVSYCPKNQ